MPWENSGFDWQFLHSTLQSKAIGEIDYLLVKKRCQTPSGFMNPAGGEVGCAIGRELLKAGITNEDMVESSTIPDEGKPVLSTLADRHTTRGRCVIL